MIAALKMDNPSFVLHGVDNVKIENRPVPHIHPDQVLVEIHKTGICGSDVHYLKEAKIGSYVLDKPMCLGHESSGVLAKVGSAASARGLKAGDRVALEPGMSCKSCEFCLAGKYHLCPFMVFAATPPYSFGTLCRYYALTSDMVHPLPDSVSLEDGAMIEPLAVATHAVSTLGQCKSDQVVFVFGAGPVGLLSMAVAKALGARRVVAVDINPDRLSFAKSHYATDSFLPSAKEKDEQPDVYASRMAERIRTELHIPAITNGAVDLAIEASGAPSCFQMAMHILRPVGTYVQVGMGVNMNQVIPLFEVINKELRVLGSFRYGPGDYPLAISLVARGLIDLKPLVTQRYDFTDALAAFETTRTGKDAKGKPAIKCIISAPL